MRTYKVNGIEYEVNEEQFSYNTTTEMNVSVSLQTLKAQLNSTKSFNRAPGAVRLRSEGTLVAGGTVAGCRLEVYSNGFAIYQAGGHTTVLRMEYVGTAWYEGDPSVARCNQSIDLSGENWELAVMLSGENMLELHCTKHNNDTSVSLCDVGGIDDETGEAVELELDAGVDVEMDVLDADEADRFMAELTQRQSECAYMYYRLGMTQEEIAVAVGIRQQNVSKALKGAIQAAKKFLKNF